MILLLNTQFAIDLQLIGGVVIMQTLPAVALGLYTNWFHRYALAAGIGAGLLIGMAMLYQVPKLGGPDGRTVVREHFGGSAWPLDNLGFESDASIYVGIVALAANLLVAVLATPVFRLARGARRAGPHPRAATTSADEGDPTVRRMTEILDGEPVAESAPPERLDLRCRSVGAAPGAPAPTDDQSRERLFTVVTSSNDTANRGAHGRPCFVSTAQVYGQLERHSWIAEPDGFGQRNWS